MTHFTRRFFLTALAIFTTCGFLAAATPARAEVTVGQDAPNFTLESVNGDTVALSQYAGKIVVLEWTNHQCPYVRKHYGSGNMQALQKEATDAGVIWLSIVSSAPGMEGYVTPEEGQMVVQKADAHATARLLDPDGTVGRLYGAKTTPHMFVIGTDGKIAYMGAIDNMPSANPKTLAGATNYVRNALHALENGSPVSPSETRPYGCSVKYEL